jgi:hypothetical protein
MHGRWNTLKQLFWNFVLKWNFSRFQKLTSIVLGP